ncbi:hypothetical protein GCM10010156_49140 [Planobispora rosea]|uniref:Uncharacterized protein n=1 Tax=Planobispora rosea TaxID=35762 RepID=A0A8J3S5C8_PLARO|nr:hypothetical protein [Planobispora rosea]GGS84672.1 hypothetical protein GCM10010156_49140 [Planobispora rosea]GIH86425.1 hypothetical protein Pro02_48330 [Planobispora rosea]
MAEDQGREVGPWQHTAERTWGDGTPDLFARPERREIDPDARQFREESIVADRSYRPPPVSVEARGPRRDLLVERAALADINQLPSEDRLRVVQHLQALAWDLPGSHGLPVPGLPTIGRSWRDSPFALITRGPDDQQRDVFQRRLRAALSPAPHNDITVVTQVEADLRALPRELKTPALQAIDALAQAPAEKLKTHERVHAHADGLTGRVRLLPLGEHHSLLYHHQPPAWGAGPAPAELPDKTLGAFSAPRRPAEALPGRGTVQLLAVCANRAEDGPTEFARLAEQRATPLPHGHLIYRTVADYASPTGCEAVQVLAVQTGARVDADALAQRVDALQASISAHQQRTGAAVRLPYAPDAAVVPVASRHAADDGTAPQRPARLAAPAAAATEGFDNNLARALPAGRRWDFVVHPRAVEELRALPAQAKAAAFRQLQDLAVYGPSDRDVKRRPPGQPSPPSPASLQAARDFDLSGFRPRYVPGDDGTPTHQIIYRAMPQPPISRQRGRRDGRPQRVTGAGERIAVPLSIPDPGKNADLEKILAFHKPPAPLDGSRDPDSRPLIVIAAVRPWPHDPDAIAVVADRSPKLNREFLASKQARPPRAEPVEPGPAYQVTAPAPARDSGTFQQQAERVDELREAEWKRRGQQRPGGPGRQQAATRRSATAAAAPAPIPPQQRPTPAPAVPQAPTRSAPQRGR